MCVDYYWCKRGNLSIADLYTGDPAGRYYFYRGWNLRAVISTALALLPCLPSFAAQIAPNHLGLSVPAQNLFYISFILTYTLAAVLYFVSYLLFPEKKLAVSEKTLRFEEWADENDEIERVAAEVPRMQTPDSQDEGEKDLDKDKE